MEIGIDSFAAFVTDAQGNPVGTAQDPDFVTLFQVIFYYIDY